MKVVWHENIGAGTGHGETPLMRIISKETDRVCKRAAHVYMRAARNAAPVGTRTTALKAAGGKSWGARRPGSLRDSIRVSKSRFKDGGWLVIIGGRDTYYWTFIEWGAWHIPATNKHKNFMLRTFKRVRHMMGRQRGVTVSGSRGWG